MVCRYSPKPPRQTASTAQLAVDRHLCLQVPPQLAERATNYCWASVRQLRWRTPARTITYLFIHLFILLNTFVAPGKRAKYHKPGAN